MLCNTMQLGDCLHVAHLAEPEPQLQGLAECHIVQPGGRLVQPPPLAQVLWVGLRLPLQRSDASCQHGVGRRLALWCTAALLMRAAHS